MKTLHDRPLLVLAPNNEHRTAVLRCAAAIACRASARLHILEHGATGGTGSDLGALREIFATRRPGMLVAEWPEGAREQEALRLAAAHDVPAVFVRWPDGKAVDRVLIPTSGGPHALHQIWVAHDIALAEHCACQPLCIVQEAGRRDSGEEAACDAALTSIEVRALGIGASPEVIAAQDVVSGICQKARTSDLIVLGAPSNWRIVEHFHGSIPDIVARRISNPLVMLLGRQPRRVRLRDVFWEQTVLLRFSPRSKREAIEMLVDALVAHNQVPEGLRGPLIERALAREKIMSTAAGGGTAFPHVALPDFPDLIGCMGICPEGVDFGDPDGVPTRFVFLLVGPDSDYEEYLAVLARIAERMVNAETRRALLKCATTGEVLQILSPGDFAAPSSPHRALTAGRESPMLSSGSGNLQRGRLGRK